MKEHQPSRELKNGAILRFGVIGIGIVLFVLLLFADKTNLDNQPGRKLEASATQASSLPAGKLPPLAPDPELDRWIAALPEASPEARGSLLDSIVTRLEARNRADYAAQYAKQLVEGDRSLDNILRAGKLFQAASRLDYIADDSTLFREYSAEAISLLEEATRLDEKNEEALYLLGLSYVESRDPQYSMQGILTIRKVLEINPGNVEAGLSLGMFSLQTEQFELAEKRFEQVLKQEADNYTAKYYLAYARYRQDKYNGVSDLLEEVLKNAKDPELKQLARDLLNNI